MRYLYTVKKFWEYRNKLRQYLLDENKKALSIDNISYSSLEKHNIKILILDFDGVLNSHGEPLITKEAETWIKKLIVEKPSLKIFILSNKPTQERKEYFAKNFPSIKFIKFKKKKPYPDDLAEIVKNNTVDPKKVLLVDDRLATGILVAEIVGCRACLITKPYVKFFKRPIRETFFTCLRFLEQKLLK